MSKDLYQFGRPVFALWLRRGSLKDLSDFYSGVKYEFLSSPLDSILKSGCSGLIR
ncbi:MAG: hypothetical protein WBM69_26300 [Desulfobacterales bacterium]